MLMASYHVAGKNKWLAFAKADQIYRLVHKFKCSPEQIADETRNMRPREIKQTLEAYEYLINEVMPKVRKTTDPKFLESKWSHALEFVKNRELADLRKDPAVRKNFAKLLINNQIQGDRYGKAPQNSEKSSRQQSSQQWWLQEGRGDSQKRSILTARKNKSCDRSSGSRAESER